MLDAIFTDHMVLQRNKQIHVYGTGKKGAHLQVTLDNETKDVNVVDEKWSVVFESRSYGGPFKIVVYDGKQTESIEDVLIGDVFLATGQSNMEFLMKNSKYYEEELEEDIPSFRYYYVNQVEYVRNGKEYPAFPKRTWEIANSSNIGDMSAVAYYMAKMITAHSDVPVGIVGCHKGGTSASCWIPEKVMESNLTLKEAYIDNYWKDIKNQTDEQEEAAREKYAEEYDRYQEKVKQYQIEHPHHSISQMKQTIGHTPWPGPKGKKDYGRPCGLFHTMFEKVKEFTFGSILWYQGEEDTKLPLLYKDLLKTLIISWRREFNDASLPFYVVQLPDYNDDKSIDNWAIVRQAQEGASKELGNIYILCTLGCGEEFNIHPTDKSVLGARLGELVLETYYGTKIAGHCPQVSQINFRQNRLECVVDFLYRQPLINTGLEKIEVSYDGEFFESVDAFVSKNIIYANIPKKPLSVRYAWKNYPSIGFERKDGKPLFPFYIKEVLDD